MADAPLALTMGDPAGIGPELAAKCWAALKDTLPFVWIGDPATLPGGTPFKVLATAGEAAMVSKNALPVLAHPCPAPVRPGQPDGRNSDAVISSIKRGVDLVGSGDCTGLCTLPISKAVLIDGAAFAYPGHTEFLAALAGVDQVVMMLASPLLRVVPATIHIPLAEVPAALNPKDLESTLRVTHAALITDFGVASPRILVAGLNPHAGEDGKIGTEDRDVIAPVVARLAAEGLDVRGPVSADTMFHEPARRRYDAAVAMYHDQALIPIKTLDFSGGVNVTLGLPFVRTSPDHGTAFDIAGTGAADPTSTVAALRLAADMAQQRAAHASAT
ncbi:MAG: 4-hydroxythreonine-4-phosphate dehydrogenase PdxA [Pseudomonadota bacterium]